MLPEGKLHASQLSRCTPSACLLPCRWPCTPSIASEPLRLKVLGTDATDAAALELEPKRRRMHDFGPFCGGPPPRAWPSTTGLRKGGEGPGGKITTHPRCLRNRGTLLSMLWSLKQDTYPNPNLESVLPRGRGKYPALSPALSISLFRSARSPTKQIQKKTNRQKPKNTFDCMGVVVGHGDRTPKITGLSFDTPPLSGAGPQSRTIRLELR